MSYNAEENSDVVIEEKNTRTLEGFWKWLYMAFCMIGLFLVVNQLFHLNAMGILLYDNQYLYILMAIFLGIVFLHYPLKPGSKLCFYFDIFLFLVTFGICAYFAYNGYTIDRQGWGYLAPQHALVMAVVLWAIILETVRRTAGLMMALIITIFSIYPVIAQYLPSIFAGPPKSLTSTMLFHTLSLDSALGIPIQVFATQLIGYMLFGVVLQSLGGGQWFLNLAYAIMGARRGGPGKVAVLASAFFGSLSGSPISNVITTGTITIPAMKKNGFEPSVAGAIESCASTGGCLMPPVMGAVAFVMAAFLGVSYFYVVVAAVIPSFLYYFGLLVQVDGYAANKKIPIMERDKIPPLLQTLKDGWVYIVSIAVLTYSLFIIRQVNFAPFYSVLVMVVIAMFDKNIRPTWQMVVALFGNTSKFLAELIAIMVGVGMIMGAFTVSGLASSISRELITLAGGNVALLLILGAVSSLILGMGMSATACYIFVAILLAPVLITIGFNPLATHLFILYYGMLSYITPPVALAAYPAATIARSTPLKVGLEAARMGGVIYFIPFFFIFNPALVFEGSIGEVIVAFIWAATGVFLLSSALSNYLLGVGPLNDMKLRVLLFVAGIMIGFPSWYLKSIGIGLVIVSAVIMWFFNRPKQQPQV